MVPKCCQSSLICMAPKMSNLQLSTFLLPSLAPAFLKSESTFQILLVVEHHQTWGSNLETIMISTPPWAVKRPLLLWLIVTLPDLYKEYNAIQALGLSYFFPFVCSLFLLVLVPWLMQDGRSACNQKCQGTKSMSQTRLSKRTILRGEENSHK